MPPILPPARVLVSGVNGFIGVWITKFLLERGYTVRGTVRELSKGEHVKKVLEPFKERLEIIEVADITAPGAFDEAVKGVDGIVHNASPFHFHAENPNELIIPAVQGTIASSNLLIIMVKRIIVLSSVAAVANASTPGKLDETSWNDYSIQEIQKLGSEAAGEHKYRASKTLAERAVWEFYEKHKSEVSWDIVALNPPYVFGPFLHEVTAPTALNTSLRSFYDIILAPQQQQSSTTDSSAFFREQMQNFMGSFVDVRDVAESVVHALEIPEAGGNRFILSAGLFNAQEIFDLVHASGIKDVAIPVGNPGAGKDVKYSILFDSTKARTILKIEFKDLKTVALDTIESMREHGFLKA